MIQQCIKSKINPLMGLGLVLCFTAGTVALSMGAFYLRKYCGVYYAEYVIYGLLILAALWVLRRFVAEYRYCLYDDEIVISRLIGHRQRVMLILHLWQIDEIVTGRPRLALIRRSHPVVRAYAYRQGMFYIRFTQEGRQGLLVCSASTDFADQVRRAMAVRRSNGQDQPPGQSFGDRTVIHHGDTP